MLFSLVAAAATAAVLAGAGRGIPEPSSTTEVVVTLKGPPLSAFGRGLRAPAHRRYLHQVEAAQSVLADRIGELLPSSRIRWHYRLVANGLAVVLPEREVPALAHVPGVAAVWPTVTYRLLRTATGVDQIGAPKIWGPNLQTSGQGIRIGIIDDGLDASHPYFKPGSLRYPPGFPKGQAKYTTPKVIVQRTFTPASPTWKYAGVPFDPTQSFHATHVAGIAAGDHDTADGAQRLTGVAPMAYLGNYKVYTIPTPDFGLDGNSPEIAAGIEAAVADGMNVINLSLGEPEVEPSRDLVVQALGGAAAAGVVPVVAAGNDFDTFGFGSIDSPGVTSSAITVAAVTSLGTIADFSSAGPTPISLQMKPDVAAPGVNVVSSLPTSQGTWGTLSGTSMAAPHVSGAVALLLQRHPGWTPAQVKSALEQTGDPVRGPGGTEALATREGGGLVDLAKADAPLLFAAPSGVSFGALVPDTTATRSVTLTDAGGGAGAWSVTTTVQQGPGTVETPAALTVPSALTLTARAGSAVGDVTGFVVLSNGSETRRIPFWFRVTAPKLPTEPKTTLTRPGTYHGNTRGGKSLVDSYRYPTAGDITYPGPERVYRVRVAAGVANVGVVVTSGSAVPHVTIGDSEDHLAGYSGLPVDQNPYRLHYGERVPAAGAVLPAGGIYDLIFDTRSAALAGPFTFRYWVNDVTPPKLTVGSLAGGIAVRATDAGSGVDPRSIVAVLDGKPVTATFSSGVIRIGAAPGRHTLRLTVSDWQETKNMEDVPRILPNTSVLKRTVVVRQ